MRALDRARPDVDVALLVEAAVEGEGVGVGPGAQDQVVRLVVAVAQQRRVLAVGVAGVHRRADREAGDQPSAGDHVDHGELFGHAGRRVVQRQRVAHDADRRIGGAARQRGRDQVGRRHQAIAVGVVLVHAHRVEAAVGGVFELVHEVVVHVVRAARIEQRGVDVDPDRGVLVAEAGRQLGVGHQVEPHQAHGMVSSSSIVPVLPLSPGLFQCRYPAARMPSANLSLRAKRSNLPEGYALGTHVIPGAVDGDSSCHGRAWRGHPVLRCCEQQRRGCPGKARPSPVMAQNRSPPTWVSVKGGWYHSREIASLARNDSSTRNDSSRWAPIV